MNQSSRHRVRYDLWLIASLLAVAAVLIFVTNLSRDTGEYVSVSVNGAEVARYSLSVDGTYDILDGANVLVIENGHAYVSHADCPDKLCVRRGKISLVGESIVCLPNRVSISVVGNAGGGSVDIVS